MIFPLLKGGRIKPFPDCVLGTPRCIKARIWRAYLSLASEPHLRLLKDFVGNLREIRRRSTAILSGPVCEKVMSTSYPQWKALHESVSAVFTRLAMFITAEEKCIIRGKKLREQLWPAVSNVGFPLELAQKFWKRHGIRDAELCPTTM